MAACYSKYMQACHTGKSDALRSTNRVKGFNSTHTEVCGRGSQRHCYRATLALHAWTHGQMDGRVDEEMDKWKYKTDKYMQPLLKQNVQVTNEPKTHKKTWMSHWPTEHSNHKWDLNCDLRIFHLFLLESTEIKWRLLRWLEVVNCFSLKRTSSKLPNKSQLFHLHSTESKWVEYDHAE